MHNRYFVEVNNESRWKKGVGFYEMFLDFNEAVEYAKTLTEDHDSVRVVDECYGKVWWEYKKEGI